MSSYEDINQLNMETMWHNFIADTINIDCTVNDRVVQNLLKRLTTCNQLA